MKREDVKKLFPDATDEQITSLLNQSNSEVANEKAKAEKMKSEMEKLKQVANNATELQAELDRINEQNLSDIEKANKATEAANNRVAELEKQMKAIQTKAKLAEKGIVGEQADKLFTEDGSIDFEILGQIISDRETKAAAKKEEDLLDNTHNPGGGTGGNPADNKPEDVKNAESITFGTVAVEQTAKDYYLMK